MNESSPRRIAPRGDNRSTTSIQMQPSPLSRIASTSHSNLQNKSSTGLCGTDCGEFSGVETIPQPPSLRGGERRGKWQRHFKSRTGCYNCKRRRIKCEENHPTCTQCARRRLPCEWPKVQTCESVAVVQKGFSGHSFPRRLRSPDAMFTMQDFRLFHHFIRGAHPRHPVSDGSVWTHEIPSISHKHEYLMHAILGFSASDLTATLTPTPEIAFAAMSHRVLAIKSLNKAMASGLHTFEEGNAMLATSYILLLQSAYMDDCLTEFLSFMRGCVLVATDMGCKNLKFLLQSSLGTGLLSKMDPLLINAHDISRESVDAACRSLESFSSLCQKEYEKSFHRSLLKAARAIYSSPREAYLGLMEIYTAFCYKMTHNDFQDFTNLANETGQVLQSHFVTLHFLLYPTAVKGLSERGPLSQITRWLAIIHNRIPPRLREYCEWPVSVLRSVQDESFFTELSRRREMSGSVELSESSPNT